MIGGILLDKWGVRVSGSLFVGMMVLGAGMVTGAVLHGGAAALRWAYVGTMLFGLGSEIAGTAVTRSIAKWFKGGPMALAMGLQLAIARLWFSPPALCSRCRTTYIRWPKPPAPPLWVWALWLLASSSGPFLWRWMPGLSVPPGQRLRTA